MAAISTVYTTSIHVMNVTAPQTEESSLEDLINKARKDHHTPTISVALNAKITSLEQNVHYSSARSGFLKLFVGLSDAHYNRERMRILDALIHLLENDPLTRETSSGIIEFVRDLTRNMKTDIAQCDNLHTREKIAHCCAIAVEMVLRHGAAGKDSGTVHIGSITESLKVELIEITRDFASLDTKKDGANLKHSINLAIEGMKRITSNLDISVDTIIRLSHIISAVSKIADYDPSSALEEFKSAVAGLENRITQSWYDILITIKGLSKLISREMNFSIARQNLSTLQQLISDNKARNWNLTYGSIHALTQIAMNSPHPQIRQFAIFGLAPICGISNSKKIPNPIYLYGCIHFLSFTAFTAKKLIKSKSKKDSWISELAEKSLRNFIKRADPTNREIYSALAMVWPEGRVIPNESSSHSITPSEKIDLPVVPPPSQTTPSPTSFYTPISSSRSSIIFPSPTISSSSSSNSTIIFGTATFDPSRRIDLTDQIKALESENIMLRKQREYLKSNLNLLRKVYTIRLRKNWIHLPKQFLYRLGLFLTSDEIFSAHRVAHTWVKIPFSHTFHIPFSRRKHFINEHLQRYTFTGRFQQVRDLNLDGTLVSDLQCIRSLPLTRLDVSNTPVEDKSLEYLKNMPLNELFLNNCGAITDGGLEFLRDHRFLYALHLSGTRMTANGITIVAKMPFLHTLSVSGIPLTDKDLFPLSHRTALRFLNLSGCSNIDGSCFQYFTEMRLLEHLYLPNTGLKDEATRYFHHMNLRTLNVSETPLSDNSLSVIGNLRLVSLNLWGNENFTNAGIKHLSKMDSLENLNLGGCIKLTDDGIRCIIPMPLQTLDLYATGATNAIYDFIKHKTLKSLSLRRCPGITTLAPLTEHPLLCHLNVSGVPFPNNHIRYLKGMRHLTDLNLRDTSITDAELPILYELPLRVLDISKTRVSVIGVECLKKALPECRIVI